MALVVDSAEFGGAERYVVHLIERLSERWTPTLLTTAPVLQELAEPVRARGGQVLVVPAVGGKADVRGVTGLVRALRRADPALVHVNLNTIANNRHALALAALMYPTVATLHIGSAIDSRVQRLILRAAFSRLSRVIAVSGEIEQQLHDELRVGSRRTTVIANGVEEAPPVTVRPTPHPLRVGGLGRLTRQKGFDVLVDAVRLLTEDDRELEVVIAGEGPERPQLEAAAAGLPIAFPGRVADPGAFLSTLDVFCLPSRWEGLPFALLEAMVRGLPCIASPVGDIADAVADAADLVAPEDAHALAVALATLEDSADRRRALGAAARARVLTRHSVAGMVAHTEAVYDEALPPWT